MHTLPDGGEAQVCMLAAVAGLPLPFGEREQTEPASPLSTHNISSPDSQRNVEPERLHY